MARDIVLRRGVEAERTLHVYADASVQAQGTGLGLAIKGAGGRLIECCGRHLPRMTNTAAEYVAVIYALKQALRFNPDRVIVFCDNQVVIWQLCGSAVVRSQALLPLHGTAIELTRRFAHCRFMHIPRERNSMADAIANEMAHADQTWMVESCL